MGIPLLAEDARVNHSGVNIHAEDGGKGSFCVDGWSSGGGLRPSSV